MVKRISWAFILLVLAAVAGAQADFLRRPSPFAGRTLLTLCLFEEVRTELKATPELSSKIDGLVEKLQAEDQEALQNANGDFDSVRPMIDKINAKYDEEVTKILSTDQNRRLKQLFIQYNGSLALSNTAIAKDLAITDEQKIKIKAALDDNGKKMREAFEGGQAEDAQKTFSDLQVQLKDALDKVLADDQRTKFKEMQGAKFEFKKVGGIPG